MAGRRVIVVVGPTASGKSAVALQLALQLGGEILSADSRQVYTRMRIGTASPSPEERALVPHHFVEEREPDEEFSAGEFGERGRERLEQIFARGHQPIVVGGSGLYVRSLIDGLFAGPAADPEYRRILEGRLTSEGREGLLADLRRVDPETASRIDPTKPRRIIRALEVHHITGRPLSAMHREAPIRTDVAAEQFGLQWPREELYRRIDARCDAMIAAGLLDEVEALAAAGFDDRLNALNTVGYREAFACRRGEITEGEMLRLFKRNSRRYAKRQFTWFRKDPRVRWIEMSEGQSPQAVAGQLLATLAGSPYLQQL